MKDTRSPWRFVVVVWHRFFMLSTQGLDCGLMQVQCAQTLLKEERRRVKQLQKQLRLVQLPIQPPSPVSHHVEPGQGHVDREERVHLMLCIVAQGTNTMDNGNSNSTDLLPGQITDEEVQAAVRIQAAYRGHRARTTAKKVQASCFGLFRHYRIPWLQ